MEHVEGGTQECLWEAIGSILSDLDVEIGVEYPQGVPDRRRRYMKTEQVVPRTVYECDGCQYVLGLTTEEKAEGKEVLDTAAILTIPWGGQKLEFHFHAVPHRNDCFRYWAHDPQVMHRSLEDRDFTDEDIDSFMAMFLYRKHSHSPGIARAL
jgi:hypothetical protein